ncbi:MAG: proline dehydrogenase family protein [Candidatus Neomarinimicrobiota bacterium]
MSSVHKSVLSLLSVFPKPFVEQFAARYVAGETWREAVQEVRKLNTLGLSATLDILGEQSRSVGEIEKVKGSYLQLYDAIEQEGLDCNISLKLSHLGLGHEDRLAVKSLREILEQAKQLNNFLRIDMENSRYTDATIRNFRECLERYKGVGIVLQSYLRRSRSDLANLMGKRVNVRVCKGIYRESREIAFQDRDGIRQSFIQLVQEGLLGDAYIAIATHDRYLMDTLETWIGNKGISRDRYEFQVLYGVPVGGRLESLVKRGHKVRVYVPFGEDWYPYAMRRLTENPRMVGYILKNFFSKM